MRNVKMLVLSSILAIFTLSGCAANNNAAFPKMDDLPSLKGQKAEYVISQFGQPDRKYTDSNGNQVWEYKKPAASQSGSNRFMAIASLGTASGSNSFYVDITRLTFSRGVVANYAYEENTMNISVPGMTNGQIPPAAPVNNKQQHVAPKVKHAVDPPASKKEAVTAQSDTSAATSEIVSTVKSSKSFSNRSVVATIDKILSGIEGKDIRIVEKSKSRIMLLTADGAKIIVNLKQVKKDVVVELNATGNFTTGEIFKDFSVIYGLV